jgi:glycosyltransferase involved in cell wall biosynthesis
VARPLVSVVVPTYNRLEWLRDAVASVQAQTLADWELLIVDDGSSDGTGEWAAALQNDRVRYQRIAHCGSIARVRNVGIDLAAGEWIGFLDSDDRWTPGKLRRQFDRLQRSPAAQWCYGAFRTIDRAGMPVATPHGAPWSPIEDGLVDRLLRHEAAVTVQTLIAPTALLRQLRFDETIPLVDDFDLAIRLAEAAPCCVVADVLAEIRLHETRTTLLRGDIEGYVGKILVFRKAASTLRDARSRRIARRQRNAHMVQLVTRTLRRGDLRPLYRAIRRLW